MIWYSFYKLLVSGHVASNRGNFDNELISLVRGHYGVLHSEVNGPGTGVGERNGIASGAGWCVRGGTR